MTRTPLCRPLLQVLAAYGPLTVRGVMHHARRWGLRLRYEQVAPLVSRWTAAGDLVKAAPLSRRRRLGLTLYDITAAGYRALAGAA